MGFHNKGAKSLWKDLCADEILTRASVSKLVVDDCYSKTGVMPDGTGEGGWRRTMCTHSKAWT